MQLPTKAEKKKPGTGNSDASSIQRQEIFEQAKTLRGEHGFGMELDAFNAQLAMAQAYDGAVGGFGGNLKRAGQRFALDNQGVVTRRCEPLRQAAKEGLAVVLDFARLAMHQPGRADHAAAECRADGLMPETHAENRNLPCEALDERDADPR